MPNFTQIVNSRHPLYTKNAPLYQYFADHAEGGVLYSQKANPLAGSLAGISSSRSQTQSARYIIQHPLEDSADYIARLSKAPAVNLGGPAVDMLAGTVGSQGTVSIDIPAGFEQLFEDADLTGATFSQFMTTARSHAAVFGLTYILVDSTRAAGQVTTERDVQEQGIRPFFREISPLDLLNWRLDANGKPVEILFRVAVECPDSIMSGAESKGQQYEYRLWDRDQWVVFRQAGDSEYEIADQGVNPLGEVPLAVLYHKRLSPFIGESLLKESAKYSQMLSNWLSDLDQTMTMQSFSQACLRSENPPSEVAVGNTKVVHLHPAHKADGGEQIGEADFFFRAPDSAPLTTMWDSYFRMVDQANASMSLSPDASTDKSHPESGISRAWRWHSLEKRLNQMVESEQSAANEMFELAAHWKGQDEFPGSITYGNRFDLTSLEQDIETVLSAQAVGLPPSAHTELKSRLVKKALPNMDPAKQTQIESELQSMHSSMDSRVNNDLLNNIG